ncbi:conserved hypothetical protein [Hyella patelloides LEGE 07179]|uniref:Uncharacterized protein n=1 Tax=Hyella patelloides LEGE 07179 TaxID=945734 RepID=A0A563VTM5_9CYAN|nr:hypothetical protein [Hyella patelloides]VEP14797.1 conserved hypothetical protein [Hyella patelloides LEGE 07179]
MTLVILIVRSTMNKNRQETLKKAALNYRQTLKKSLQRRLESARAEGNDKLIRQLEAEANYLHLN